MTSITPLRQMASRMRAILALIFAVIGLSCLRAAIAQVPVALNTPQIVSGAVTPGMTSLELPFAMSAVDRLSMDVIVPLDGASISLVDPAGTVVLLPGDPRVIYNPGRLLSKPLPGGVFVLPELPSPTNGIWRIRLTFPPASTRTAAMATILAVSRYQVGIVTDRNLLLVGEDISVGMIVLDNGVPMLGLEPTLSARPVGGTVSAPVLGLDNGIGPDGLANDGIYSIDQILTVAGSYDLLGTVLIPTQGGPVQRSATLRVRADSPSLNNPSIDLANVLSASGCVSAFQVNVGLNVLKPSSYSIFVKLSGSNSRSIDFRKALTLASGQSTTQAVFTAKAIKESIGIDGPYVVKAIDVLDVGGSDFTLAFRRRDAGSFTVPQAGMCSQPIELPGPLSVVPVLKSGFIGSLDVSFPIKVTVAGNYQISFKLIGSAGEDLGLVNASRQLNAGNNIVTTNVATEGFLLADGPYQVVSLLVLGGGNSVRQATVGISPAFSRWAFYPRITGDLNGDGSVDDADNALVSQFRGIRALNPGDRRDINRDGVIDLRDARELQKLACKAPNCTTNP